MSKDGKQGEIRTPFIALELKALSMLLNEWSKSGHKTTPKKLQALRDAMMRETGIGGKEQAPFEVVIDEYSLMLEHIESFIESGVSENLYCTVDGVVAFNRAFPGDRATLKCIEKMVSSGRKREVIARQLVSDRLLVSESTIKNGLKKLTDRRFHATPKQRLIVSLFLDVSSWATQNQIYFSLLSEMLEVLVKTGYDARACYYLAQKAHELRDPISLKPPDYKEVEKLLEFLT